MSRIRNNYDGFLEDIKHDEAVQREVDERHEVYMNDKRNAAEASIEEITLLDAYIDGRKAGRDFVSPEMNPYPAGSAKADAWNKGRLTTLASVTQKRSA